MRRQMIAIGVSLCLAALGAPAASADVGSLTLPDNRAWEQVSPTEKNGSDIADAAGLAAPDGNRLMFKSPGAFAGAAASMALGGGVTYIAHRDAAGWSTASVMPPVGADGQGYTAVTPDLSRGVLQWYEQESPLDPEAHVPAYNLYLHDMAGGPFELLTRLSSLKTKDHALAWASADLGKIAIESTNVLSAESPCLNQTPFQANRDDICAYEWDHGTMRLASVVNEEPVEGTPGDVLAGHGSADHAVSEDGVRLFFTSPAREFSTDRRLYVREEGTSTQLISGSERTLPGGVAGESTYFQDAEAAHGGRVIFTTKNSLVDEDQDTTNDLYLYDFSRPEGERLTLISEDQNPAAPQGADVGAGSTFGGVVGAAEDLSRIYFVAANQILAGAPEEAGPKLYLWDDTGAAPRLSYLARLGASEVGVWGESSQERKSRLSAGGRFLLFPSHAQLTEFENEGREELYRYDALSESFQCASCSADAFPAEGALELIVDPPYTFTPRNRTSANVSESGQVFFQTTRGLLPRDSNAKMDVYEYEEGQLHLISTGTGGSDSYLLDASPSGSDVFFVTRDRLVGWDKDELFDAYDARVNGGLPGPPPPPPPCEGDSCQPPPLVPVDPSLGSASFNGPGDAKPRKARRCRAGKVRRHGHCRAKRKAHAKRKGIGR